MLCFLLYFAFATCNLKYVRETSLVLHLASKDLKLTWKFILKTCTMCTVYLSKAVVVLLLSIC